MRSPVRDVDALSVVTGGARGLGNLFARTFVESGSNSIVIVDLIEEQAATAAKELADWFVEHGEAQPDEIQAVGVRHTWRGGVSR